jgi:hypothetical protein
MARTPVVRRTGRQWITHSSMSSSDETTVVRTALLDCGGSDAALDCRDDPDLQPFQVKAFSPLQDGCLS